MVNQKNFFSMKEKELKKKWEELMNNPSSPDLYAMLLQNQNRASFGITTTMGNQLIPRVVNIMVCPVNTDIRMEAQRQRHFSNNNNNNSQHGIRPTSNGATNNNMDLHRAVQRGILNDVRNVVHRHRELLWHKEPNEGSLSLHEAILNGNKEVASFLAKEYPQGSYALNHTKISPLYLAVKNHHLDLAKEMLLLLVSDSHAPIAFKEGKSIIHLAIENKNKEMLKMILKYQRDLIKRTDEQGLTPLSYAAYYGFVEIVEHIIKKFPRAVSHYKNDDGSTPIHKACLGGHLDVLKKFPSDSLLETDADRRTVLHLAAKARGDKLKDVVSWLFRQPEGKQLINKKDANKHTPLDLAIKYNNGEVMRLIENMR